MTREFPTFIRSPKDRSNPYSMISNDLIRNKELSIECIWLLIYLLSNKDGWRINIKQIMNHCSGRLGRDKIYKLVNEAIKAGYIEKHKCFRNIEYHVSEYPIFKNNDPENQFTENQDPRNQDPENTDTKEDYNPYSKDKEDYQEKQIGANAPSVTSSPPPPLLILFRKRKK